MPGDSSAAAHSLPVDVMFAGILEKRYPRVWIASTRFSFLLFVGVLGFSKGFLFFFFFLCNLGFIIGFSQNRTVGVGKTHKLVMMFLWCPIFDVWLNLKHPESIHESCTGQSTGQQVLHGNFFPSAGLFHAGFVACTLDIKSPLPLYSQQMNNPADFFFTRDITSCPSRPFPF